MIEKLTPEQEALIPIIRDEWIQIALDTSPTDKQKAEAAINLTYQEYGYKPPKKILWFDNPLSEVIWIASNRINLGEYFQANYVPDVCSYNIPENILNNAINAHFDIAIKQLIYEKVFYQVKFALENFCESLEEVIGEYFPYNKYDIDDEKELKFIEENIYDCQQGIWEFHYFAYFAYFNVIAVNSSKFNRWWNIAKECGSWWRFFENVAIVTPKPSQIHLDNDDLLNAEGKPAVNYEGFKIYAHHGIIIPEKYGKIHPSNWKSEWLLSEKKAELRRIVIKEIGYYRICQELQAVELDAWEEYTLLKINKNIDIESIHLLKMICPSTKNIHILRVPPDINSAREAIAWINWGIYPEEFALQT